MFVPLSYSPRRTAELESEVAALRVAECEGALQALVDRCMELNLSECEPALGRAREALASSPSSPVSALIEAGRLAVEETRAEGEFNNGTTLTLGKAEAAYEAAAEARRKACAAIIEKEKSDAV